MHRTYALTIALVLAAAFSAEGADERPSAGSVFRVIINPANPTTTIDRKALAELFLKRSTRWSNGEVVRPVDLDAESALRKKFSTEVLSRSVPAVKSYWQQVIFSGRDVPPPELDSDEEVVKFVLKNVGAVGYVSGTTPLNGAKVLTVN